MQTHVVAFCAFACACEEPAAQGKGINVPLPCRGPCGVTTQDVAHGSIGAGKLDQIGPLHIM